MRLSFETIALGATLGWILACGGTAPIPGDLPDPSVSPAAPAPEAGQEATAAPSPPAEPEPPTEVVERPKRPGTTQPGTVLVLRKEDAACKLVLLTLPGLEERALGPCPCHTDELFLEQTGSRVLASNTIVDLKAGTAQKLPDLPSHLNQIISETHFDAAGKVVATTEWGEGEPDWEEGPSYPIWRRALYVLTDGAWVEKASTVSGGEAPSTEAENTAFSKLAAWSGELVFRHDGGPDGEWVSEEAAWAPMDEASGTVADSWYTVGPDPLLAYQTMQMGEGSALEHPVLVKEEGGWTVLPGVPKPLETLDRRGDWLLAGGSDWVLIDLQSWTEAASGTPRAWFWPEGVPVP